MGHKYVKENETFDTSRNGTVPKPTQADVTNNKILQADGSWVPQSGGGGGSSTLAGLSDVVLSSPSDSQILQYDDSSSKWINADPPASSSSIETLTDVDLDNLSDGQMLQYDDSSSKWVNVDPPSGGGDVTDVEVNGTSVVDENGVAEIVSYKEVTQAEYNALPASKTSDGILYCIKDAPSSPEGFPPLIYSFEEREIGVWADGKPLYEITKTVDTGSSTSASIQLDTSIADVISVIGKNLQPNGNVVSVNYYAGDTDRAICYFRKSDYTIQIRAGSDYGKGQYAITVRYTKTTDVAGSGKWTIQGALAHHYSTSEQVIGTWIDGKPIYEKTVSFGAIAANKVDYQLDCSILTVDNLVDINCMVYSGNNFFRLPLSLFQQGSTYYDYGINIQGFNKTTGKVRIDTGTSRSISGGYITLQYTKTTD